MTDQTIPADDVREIIEKMRDHANHNNVRGSEEEYVRFFARQLHELLPTPPLPTLADMTPEARRECQWMQCEVRGERRIITLVSDDDDHNDAVTLAPSGSFFLCSLEIVTPRPDLPRMEWPGNQKPEPALPGGWRLADHKGYGRGVVTNPTPNRDGRVYFVIPDDDPMGYEWVFCTPDDLTYIDTDQ